MKQIIQDIKHGATILEEVPVPLVKSGHILIRTTRSLVSLGTERMLVEFGQANLVDKARQQPDKVRQVLDKIKTDGLAPTLEAVFNKLGQPIPLGYCNVGVVEAVGRGVSGIAVGDRVASNGHHAEYVCVPQNLVAKIPDNVSDEEAAFTVIGAIGLQGVRLVKPEYGETVVVIGLGLIGLIAAQLLRSNGCRVVGIDYDEEKNKLARQMGIITINPAEGIEPVSFVNNLTDGIGADAVLITASSKSDDIIHNACEMSRKRGRIVLVGVVGLNIRRDDFYKKELSFQVSCSYGPGRYDESYEQKGNDYPIAYVRWTEQRNFETILYALSEGMLNVRPLITEVMDLEDYQRIYSDMRRVGAIASILRYPEGSRIERIISVNPSPERSTKKGKIGIIGAGNFTSSTVLPHLSRAKAEVKYIASAEGLSAKTLARKHKVEYATSDYREMLGDEEVSTVIITTRHNMHASMVVEALKAGKSVFVEKPLCLCPSELSEIAEVYRESSTKGVLTVGFNRRFSPFALKLKELSGDTVKNVVITVNAGAIPRDVWVQDMEVGGGRIIGEACHFIDLASFLIGSEIAEVCMNALGKHPEEATDNASILLRCHNGSNVVINYFANGVKAYPKERIEVFSEGKVFVVDNWRKLTAYGVKGFSSMSRTMDKGHAEQFRRLKDLTVHGGEALISFGSLVNTTVASFASLVSLKERRWVKVSEVYPEA